MPDAHQRIRELLDADITFTFAVGNQIPDQLIIVENQDHVSIAPYNTPIGIRAGYSPRPKQHNHTRPVHAPEEQPRHVEFKADTTKGYAEAVITEDEMSMTYRIYEHQLSEEIRGHVSILNGTDLAEILRTHSRKV